MMKQFLMIFCLALAGTALRAQAVLADGAYPNLLDPMGQKFTFTIEDVRGTMEFANGCKFELARKTQDPKFPNTFVFAEAKPRVASAECTADQLKQTDRSVDFVVEPVIKCTVRSNGKMPRPQTIKPLGSGN